MTATPDELLTDRQLRFIYEYLQDQNASAAAVRAGYSEKSRASAAHDLMNHPGVQARLREEMAGLLAELRCSALELMKERMRAAFFRADKMFKGGWDMRDLEEMEPEVRDALEVSSVMRKSGPVLRVKQPDRDRALRALEKVHERLDRLNEKYWDRLEKQGKVKSLEEIEAMDGGAMEAGVADGGMMAAGTSGALDEEASGHFLKKDTVFLGCPQVGASQSESFPEKTMVFSGSRGGARRSLPDAPAILLPDLARVAHGREACPA